MPHSAGKSTSLVRSLDNFRFDSLVVFGAIACGVVWSLLSGKDLNWDQLNYHFYLGYSLFEGRIDEDFLPANGQSYLNPLGYAPFYWMVSHHWHSLLIASLLAVLPSLNAVAGYFIAKAVIPRHASHARIIAVSAAALTFLSPVLLMEIGTTFIDAETATLMMAAIALALHAERRTIGWRDPAILCGLLIGSAAALKLSNLVFAPAYAVVVAIVQPSWSSRIRSLLLLGVGFSIGFVVFDAYWGWQLWKQFGNPLLPYFGSIFPSDVYPKEGAPLERFLPETLLDALVVPFRMTLLRAWIYIENVAPDLRFAALVLLAIVAVVLLIIRRRPILEASSEWRLRKYVAVVAYFAIAYGLWQFTSGNGRYGLVVSLLCGPIVALTIFFVAPRIGLALSLVSALIAAQTFHMHNGDLRWSKSEWTADWYDIEVPERLKSDAALFISVGRISNSYVAPYLSRESSFTNPIGQISFELEGFDGDRLQSMFQRYKGRVRVIASAPDVSDKGDAVALWAPGIDNLVARLDFAVDRTDCEMITSADGATEIGAGATEKSNRKRRLLTCRLMERPYAFAAERARMTRIAKQVIDWCPKLFKPSYTALEQTDRGWMAVYPSTDSTLLVNNGMLVGEFFRSSRSLSFGSVEQWEQGTRPSCADFPDKPRNVYNFFN